MIDTSEKLFELTVYLPLSNQNVGRSRHWSSASKVKSKWVNSLKGADVVTGTGVHFDLPTFHAEVLNGNPLAQRVGIVTTRVLGKGMRLWDFDSIGRGDCKEAIDSIVKCGILSDDSPKHVAWWLGQQDDSQRSEGPFTVFTFYGSK